MRFIPTILAILTVLCTGTPAIALQLDAAEHGIAGAAALPAEDESSAYQGGMSLDEAVEWARRCPEPMPGEESDLEIRPLYEAEDLVPAKG